MTADNALSLDERVKIDVLAQVLYELANEFSGVTQAPTWDQTREDDPEIVASYHEEAAAVLNQMKGMGWQLMAVLPEKWLSINKHVSVADGGDGHCAASPQHGNQSGAWEANS